MTYSFLLVALAITAGYIECTSDSESIELENKCGRYCFKVVNPILGHINKLHNQVSNSEERLNAKDIKAKYSEVLSRLTALETRLAVHEANLWKTEQKLTVKQYKEFTKIGEKYYFIEDQQKKNWFAAKYRCQELGAHLASLQNEAEFEALNVKLKKYNDYWIDINDLAQEGVFLSDTTRREAPYLNWEEPLQPDNYNNEEHCVHLMSSNRNRKMNDLNCNFTQSFICEA